MRFTPFAYFGETGRGNNILPVSGSIFWMDVSIGGINNLAPTTASWIAGTYVEIPPAVTTYSSASNIITDTTSSAVPNNAVNMAGANVYDLDRANGIGTIVMVYRITPTSSFAEPNDPCSTFYQQLTSNRIINSNDSSVGNNFPNIGSLDTSSVGVTVTPNYVSGSYYAATAANDLTKFTPISASINTPNNFGYAGNLLVISGVCDVRESGSWNQFPGPASGSGVIHNYTGMTYPKFYAFSPEYVVTGSAGVINVGIFSEATTPNNPRQPGTFAPHYGNNFNNSVNMMSLAIFDRILNDAEVAVIYSYYKSQLGYYI
jgi:hypothetical protein